MNSIPDSAQDIATSNVIRAFFQGFVESRPPATLITQLASPEYCHDFTLPRNTQHMLSQTFGEAFSSKFIPRFLPGTSPLQCESLYTLSVFDAFAQQSLSVLSISDATVQGPEAPPYAGVGTLRNCTPFGPSFAVGTFSYKKPDGTFAPVLSDVLVLTPSASTPLVMTDSTGLTSTFSYDPGFSSAPAFGLSPPDIFLAFPSVAACQAFFTATTVVPARFTISAPSL
jgi:hypothetical protein